MRDPCAVFKNLESHLGVGGVRGKRWEHRAEVQEGERAHCLRLRCFLYLFIPFSPSSPFVFLVLISFER